MLLFFGTDILKLVDSPGSSPSEPTAYVQSVSSTFPEESVNAPFTSTNLYVFLPLFVRVPAHTVYDELLLTSISEKTSTEDALSYDEPDEPEP